MTAPQKLTRADYVDRNEAAEILGVHPNTIDRMSKRGDDGKPPILSRYRVRGVRGVLYLRSDVEGAIEPIPHDEEVAP